MLISGCFGLKMKRENVISLLLQASFCFLSLLLRNGSNFDTLVDFIMFIRQSTNTLDIKY